MQQNIYSVFITILFYSTICTYDAHVVLVHGILGDAHSMKPTKQYIKEAFGDRIYIKNIELGLGKATSWFNMETQVEWLREELQNDPELQGKSIIIIAHSQGGLVSRYFIEQYNEPHVRIYIALGSPQQGVVGTPSKIDDRLTFLNYLERIAYKFMYSSWIQSYFSVAGYWRDTLHYDDYLNHCHFLPRLNNDIDHENTERFKNNICALEQMVLVKATQEDVVEPAESCHFGFYPVGKGECCSEIEDLIGSDYFNQDKLGLKTLYDRGSLHFGIAYCTHRNLQEDKDCFNRNIYPFLQLALDTSATV